MTIAADTALRRLHRPRLSVGARGVTVALSLGWLALLVLLYLARTLVAGDPVATDPLHRLAPPFSPGHPLGSDELGRDVLARIVWGTPFSLAFGLVPTVVAVLVGGLLGLVAGASGRIVNGVVMRLMDVFYAFPPILIALAIVGALGTGLENCLIALTIVLIPPVTRVTEAATVQVCSQPYVEAARLSGGAFWRVLMVQVLPNVVPPVTAYVTSIVGIMIIYGAGLSFLGLGVATPTPEWGLMLNDLRTTMFMNPLVAALPGLFIFVTSLAFSTLGEALEGRWAVRRA